MLLFASLLCAAHGIRPQATLMPPPARPTSEEEMAAGDRAVFHFDASHTLYSTPCQPAEIGYREGAGLSFFL